MDLYREAQAYPRRLRGAAEVVSWQQLGAGGTTKAAAKWRKDHGQLRRPFRGVYLTGVEEPDLLDLTHAALAVSPPDAVLGFHTAAALQGFGVMEDSDVHIVVPASSEFPWRKGIRVHHCALPLGDIALVRGVPCTPAARTAIDLVRTLERAHGLPVLDAALAAQACKIDDLLAEVARHRSLPGVRRVRPLVSLADGRSDCTQETHLRLIIHDGGLSSFVPQVEVADRTGRVRYVLDLADIDRKVAAEYDGASHNDRVSADRARHNWLVDRGWDVRYFTKDDLYRHPETIVPLLRRALWRR